MDRDQQDVLPRHIAIIMDGNGRWAKDRFMPRIVGHKAGVEAAKKVVKHCLQRRIQVLTLFAFSSENWRRPLPEVTYLMDLFLKGLQKEILNLHKEQIQLRFIGNRAKLSSALQQHILEAESLTKANTRLILQIAVDYGGQWDICQAMQKIGHRIESGELTAAAINEALVAQSLSFADLPDPDFFIRTSGEMRISNFMLWQLAYAELYFTPIYWPDFNEAQLDIALADYAKRERRFGLSEEVPC